MKRTLVSILWIIVSLAGMSQNSLPVPMTDMVIKQWTVKEGLISNNLTSVNQTKDGFIWITTFNGIHRFDGANFKLYNKENVDFLETNAFYGVSNDSTSILLSSQGSGVIRYKDGMLSPVDAFSASSVRKIIRDSQGTYWCGTNNEGLFMMKDGIVTKVDFDAFEHVVILDIYEDSRKRVWFATEGKGMVLFENDKFVSYTAEDLLEDNTVTTISESKSGTILVGSLSGLYTLNKELTKATVIPELQNIYINDLVEDDSGLLWIATERGLYRHQLTTGYTDLMDASNGLSSNQVSSVIVDHEGSIWISTKKSGLIRMNLGSILTIGAKEGVTSTKINVVGEDGDRIYIGTDDGSIFVRENERISPINLSTKERQLGVRDFMFADNTLWVASYLGLHKYRDGKEELLTIDDGLSSNLIRKILPSGGYVWLASRSGGVMKLKDGKVVKIFNTDNGLKSNFVLALEEDNNGDIVVGTHSGGISIIHDDTVQTFMPDIGGLVIFNIHVDDQNRYWICSSIGVFVFENEEFRKLELEASFKTEAVFDFKPDLVGNIWMTSIIGIIRIKLDQLNEFNKGSRSTVEGFIFDSNDGMSTRECTGATRSTRLSNGNIWIPTLDGVAVVDPTKILSNTKIPEVSVTSLIVDDKPLNPTITKIEPGKLRYEFEFSSNSFLAPDRVFFKYQLSGLDETWIETDERRIEYTNLSPGEYTFSVIGSNSGGIWNETGDSRTFIVEPFYYQTIYFKILIGALIIVSFYFIFIWRVARVQSINSELTKVNEELDRFVYSASHDIRAPLTSILGAANIAKLQDTIEEKDMSLDMIEKSAKKLDGFIRDIIDYSRNQRLELVQEDVNLKEEVDSILESLKYLDEEGKITVNINIEISHFSTDVRRLRVILKNIIANAFFYNDPLKSDPFVTVDCLNHKSSDLMLHISDNGLGMKEDIVKNIFTMFYRGSTDSRGSGLGLYIAKENIEKLNGTIDVSSKLHEGTTFTIILPRLEV